MFYHPRTPLYVHCLHFCFYNTLYCIQYFHSICKWKLQKNAENRQKFSGRF
ncbi:hypothetical protein CLOBOL_02480 [Enterocloster bolteae ATCC BAA-613]|uniref:Uncharacterized protein n=1 Tax=Enterocloster bolteae (strain ATCC BAA-613 / DSM 15670 / CCUG 46953 / JCM 12243 / WAL 16351) TaxID=411902 RepID=A8RPI7_ENTBW|nr:hypothetical protein CLOBOL_02480 [Enterocloster bolteae ATCC BAA-613]